MRVKHTILLLCLSLVNPILLAQEADSQETIQKLITLSDSIVNGYNDSTRIHSNNQFRNILSKSINQRKSYLSDFSEVEFLSVLQPKDKRFKLFTWFLPKKNGTFQYFGMIQKCKKNGKKCTIHWLEQTSKLNNNIQAEKLTTNNWYGCLYYDIIPIKINNDTYYTLLGWDGHNSKTTKKIIDILTIPKSDEPIFGANIFNNNKYRIIIEYASQYPISLGYDENLDYIVFDHIEPIDGISTNNFGLYATNLSYDILKRTQFGWQLEESIYLNNLK